MCSFAIAALSYVAMGPAGHDGWGTVREDSSSFKMARLNRTFSMETVSPLPCAGSIAPPGGGHSFPAQGMGQVYLHQPLPDPYKGFSL